MGDVSRVVIGLEVVLYGDEDNLDVYMDRIYTAIELEMKSAVDCINIWEEDVG